jgi:importin-4
MQEILDVLAEIQFYFHENIRYHVCQTYLQIAVGLQKYYTGAEKFDWKKNWPQYIPLPDKVQEFLDTIVLPHYFQIFE